MKETLEKLAKILRDLQALKVLEGNDILTSVIDTSDGKLIIKITLKIYGPCEQKLFVAFFSELASCPNVRISMDDTRLHINVYQE